MSLSDQEKIVVITGIDTGVGKTVATGLLARWFKENGSRVITMKMVQTGCNDLSEDIVEHRKLSGMDLLDEDAEGLTCPYVFPVPCSPHLAARLHGSFINPDVIKSSADQLAEKYERVLLEGVGGLFVPLNDDTLLIDLIANNRWQLLLVTGPKLGSINHTLAALEAIENRNIPLLGLIYNLEGSRQADPRIVQDSRIVFAEKLQKMGGTARICDIPEVTCTTSYCVDFSTLFN